MNYKSIVVPKLTNEETLLGDVESNEEEEEIERKGEEEEEVEQPPSEAQMSWENEFREELDGLPADEEVEEFDPEGDLAYLEALLEGSSMMDIKQEEVVVEEEEHHSWPVVMITNVSKSSKPWEKAMRRSPGKGVRDRRGSAKSKRKEPLKRDQSSCYMPRIKLMPGKFKFWWFDPFQMFKIFYNSIIKCLMFYEDRWN
ncbi:hypothetical protein HanHA300_Chr15g0551701 [Helianthus annuus]|nr:hypothetical protein HanHA300_Chr15g0551701 [Helianthus annuus]KAJ0829830.1 hypothetical protein HanPSC8_Chr15g0648271 [Helianthus annuus]